MRINIERIELYIGRKVAIEPEDFSSEFSLKIKNGVILEYAFWTRQHNSIAIKSTGIIAFYHSFAYLHKREEKEITFCYRSFFILFPDDIFGCNRRVLSKKWRYDRVHCQFFQFYRTAAILNCHINKRLKPLWNSN